jgi:hypothetical protein
MGTTGKLNDYNEFSGNRSRQRSPCFKSGGLFFVRDFEDTEAFEVWVRIQFGNGHDQLKMHVLNTLFAAGEGLTSKQYGFVTGTVLTVEDVVEPGFWDLVSHAKIIWRLFTHNFTVVCVTRLHGSGPLRSTNGGG